MDGPERSEDFRRALNESAQLLGQNRPGEAIAKLELLLAESPSDPDVAINLSGAYIMQRKWNKAVKLLKKLVAIYPDNAMLWTNLGAAQLGQIKLAGPKQQEKAIEAYQQALHADSEAPNVHYHLGIIYVERGELTRASAFFQRALEINSADRDAQHWLDRIDRKLADEQNRDRPEGGEQL